MQIGPVQPGSAVGSVSEMSSPTLNKKKGCSLPNNKSICALFRERLHLSCCPVHPCTHHRHGLPSVSTCWEAPALHTLMES